MSNEKENPKRPLRLVKSVAVALALVTSLAGSALEPPTPEQVEAYRRDGSLCQRIESARAIGNHKVSPARARDLNRRLSEMAGRATEASMAPPQAWQGMPTKGTVKIFALLLSFSDMPSSNEAAEIDSELFGDGHGALPYDSLRNFYRRSSYGLLEIGGATLGWYQTSYPRSSVEQSTWGRQALIKEALNYYDAHGHDFSQYDNDGDGAIDYFVVIWTGPDTGWANFWWGYQTYFYDDAFRLDGKSLSAYSWQWEANPYPGPFGPYVAIHETGHALGLPDYYDYDDSIGPRGGVGGLDQMDGYGDHNCFSKMLLEWLTPTFCGETGTHPATLFPSCDSKDALLVMPEVDENGSFGEYYMVQLRFRNGNDMEFPNDGLTIWHVDSSLDMLGYNFIYDNSYSDHKLLRLMEADGLEQIEQNYWGDSGDFYTPGSAIGPSTTPNSNRYSGGQTGIEVKQITDGGDNFTFDLTCSGGDPCSGSRPIISGAKYVGSTKTFKVTGSGFKKGMTIFLYGQPLKTKFKKATLLTATIPSMPKGTPFEVRVQNTQTGCTSLIFPYTR